jgi:MFS family permease
MPIFLLGGLAVQVSADLSLTPSQIGVAVAVYFGTTALASVPVGGLVERYGPRRTAQLGVLIAAAGLGGIAIGARSLVTLLIILAACATSNALSQLASNGLLARAMPAHRQGLTFGIKQSAIPLTTLLAGASVPAIGLSVGWRWAFALAAVVAVATLLLVPADPAVPPQPAAKRSDRATGTLVVLGAAAVCASSAGNSIGTFLVASTVDRGIDPGRAGLTLTLGSAVCIAVRVGAGWLADRRSGSRHLTWVAMLLGIGAVGMVVLSLPSTAALVAGVVLGFGFGWAWPGLQNYAIVRLHPQAPAAATSVTQTGVYAGAALGPLTLGFLAEDSGYASVWLVCSGLLAMACALVLVGARGSRPPTGRPAETAEEPPSMPISPRADRVPPRIR